VRLRPWAEADLVQVHREAQDPLIGRFTPIPSDQTLQDVERYFARHEQSRLAGEELALLIADADSDALLGAIGLLRFDWPHRRCEIGYWLAASARGRGVATRAVRLLSHWALLQGIVARVELHTDVDNEASQRVAERCGFTRERELRPFVRRDGRRLELAVFTLVRDDLSD
jgi:RimJ/RimL family protein N-acetyltransferase